MRALGPDTTDTMPNVCQCGQAISAVEATFSENGSIQRRLCFTAQFSPLLCAAGLVLSSIGYPAQSQDMIRNPSLPATSLKRGEAVLLFSLRAQRWYDGQSVKVFVLPDDHPVHSSFSKKILGLFPYQLRRVWDRQVFSGTGQAPTIVYSEAEMIDRVSGTRGAIGYVGTSSISGNVSKQEVAPK
jgi:hypothetical protein